MWPGDESSYDYAELIGAFSALTVTTVAVIGCTAKALHYCWRPDSQRRAATSSTINASQAQPFVPADFTPADSEPDKAKNSEGIELMNHALDLIFKMLDKNNFLYFSTDLFNTDLDNKDQLETVHQILGDFQKGNNELNGSMQLKFYLTALKQLWDKNISFLHLDWNSYLQLFNEKEEDFPLKAQKWGQSQLDNLRTNYPQEAKLFHNWMHLCYEIQSRQHINGRGPSAVAEFYLNQFLSLFNDVPASGNFGRSKDVLMALVQDREFEKDYQSKYGCELKNKQAL